MSKENKTLYKLLEKLQDSEKYIRYLEEWIGDLLDELKKLKSDGHK